MVRKFICLLPYSEIDWSATGSMLCGIMGIIAVIVSVVVAVKQCKINTRLGNQQKVLTNNQIKVQIFERRFKVYETFCDFYDFSDDWIFNKQEGKDINDGLKGLCHNLGYKIESPKNATKDMLNNIRRGHELKQIINKERFIFENRQIDEIKKYIDVFTYQLYEFCRFETYSNDYNQLKSIHQKIKVLKIKDLIEAELSLDNNWDK